MLGSLSRPPAEFEAYLFDLDGTLVDSAPDIHAALNHALTQAGLPSVALSLTRDFVGTGSKALINLALTHIAQHQMGQNKENIEDVNPEPMLENFLNYYENNIAVYSQPFPGTRKTLATLKNRGAKLSVVTNKYVGLSELVLNQLELREYFTCVVGSETTPHPKPAADPALHACRELEVAPENALFVGDASPDVGCARAAGCEVVVRREGYNNGVPASELGADAVIDAISELL